MAAKALLVFGASALFIQVILGQFTGNALNAGFLNNGYGNGLVLGSGLGLGSVLGNAGLGCGNGGLGYSVTNLASAGLATPASGGALGVSSTSPLYPSGLGVVSENAIGGSLDVSGVLPFVSVVAVEGEVPSAGAAGVQYSCGNGNIGIQSVAPAGLGYGAGLRAGLGYGAGLGAGFGAGLGYGAVNAPCGCGLY